MHRKRVVQHAAFAGRLWSLLKSLRKATEFLGLIAIVGAEIFPAVRLLDGMCQAMGPTKANGPG